MKTARLVCLPLFLAAIGCSASDPTTPTGKGPGTNNGPSDTPAATADGGAAAGKPRALIGPSHGSTVALSDDDTRVAMVNVDVGTLSVFSVEWSDEGLPTLTKIAEVPVGDEPAQVVIHPNNESAFVVTRKDQKLVRVDGLKGAPKVSKSTAVGSEPTGVALAPTGATAWVTNEVDGTVLGITTESMTVSTTVDLNATIAASGLLGPGLAGRPALAHPRSIAITNNGNLTDTDESIYVTDYYAIQKEALATDGSNVSTSRVGVVYKIPIGTKQAQIIELPPMADMGFKEASGKVAGCYPNQLASIVIQGGFGYVSATCAASKAPTGLFTGPAAAVCTQDSQCPGAGVGSCAAGKCKTNCAENAQCGAVEGKCTSNVCEMNPANVRRTFAPTVSIIDLGGNKTIATVNLAKEYHAWYEARGIADDANRRVPLLMNEVAFIPGTVDGWFVSSGTDALFRVQFDATYAASTINGLGDPKTPFLNLAPAGVDPSKVGRVPTGLAVAHKLHAKVRFGFAANDATRNLSVVDLDKSEVAGVSDGAPVVAGSTAMPTDTVGKMRLEGRRLLTTGLGRWSWKGQGWGACLSCHGDGLSDNVTWNNAPGPTQPGAFDVLFNKKDPSEGPRINTWRARFDEASDHEAAARSFGGGIGAIVSSTALEMSARSPLETMGQSGLNGASYSVASTCAIDDWEEMIAYMKVVRSPRRPTNLDAAKVAEGKDLFAQAGCQGCHGGQRWSLSKAFYTPDATGVINNRLKTLSWSAAVASAGFPTALLPAVTPAAQTMRYSGANAALDQLTCKLRPVGTYGVAEPGVGVLEVRGSDFVTPAPGNEPDGRGFNTPSLLGVQLGAPFLHAGQARTLEALFSETFATHLRALNPAFLPAADPNRNAKMASLIQYVLSVDEDQEPMAIPPVGPGGGDFCSAQ